MSMTLALDTIVQITSLRRVQEMRFEGFNLRTTFRAKAVKKRSQIQSVMSIRSTLSIQREQNKMHHDLHPSSSPETPTRAASQKGASTNRNANKSKPTAFLYSFCGTTHNTICNWCGLSASRHSKHLKPASKCLWWAPSPSSCALVVSVRHLSKKCLGRSNLLLPDEKPKISRTNDQVEQWKTTTTWATTYTRVCFWLMNPNIMDIGPKQAADNLATTTTRRLLLVVHSFAGCSSLRFDMSFLCRFLKPQDWYIGISYPLQVVAASGLICHTTPHRDLVFCGFD